MTRAPLTGESIPRAIREALALSALVVEVGVGGRWGTLADLAARRPDLRLVATDVHERALTGAPAGVRAVRDDVTRPTLTVYAGAALIYAVRCPEELQGPLARLARDVGARLALVVLKDELADLAAIAGPARLLRDGAGRTWRVHDAKARAT